MSIPGISNKHDVSRDRISEVPRESTLTRKAKTSDVGGNADGKLGSVRMTGRARPFCAAPDSASSVQKPLEAKTLGKGKPSSRRLF